MLYNNTWQAKKKISAGSFGVVYQGYDVRNKEYVAIKVEKPEVDELLSMEREVLILKQLHMVPHVPRLIWHGKESAQLVMVIQLLGRDLTHFLRQRKKFSLGCVLLIVDQLLTTLELIHNRGVLHRDLKPENILVGRGIEQDQLYIVDYGISKIYKEANDRHMYICNISKSPPKDNKPFLGTTRYASISAHQGYELSRKDDLESLAYVIIYLLKGQLPWQSIKPKDEKEKARQVGFMKMKLTPSELCKDLPIEFARFLDMVKKLPFKQQPDYKYAPQFIRYYQQMFRRLGEQQMQILKFDWSDSERALKAQRKSSSPLKKQTFDPLVSPLMRKRSEDTLQHELTPLRQQKSQNSVIESQYSDVQYDASVMVFMPNKIQRVGSFVSQDNIQVKGQRSISQFNKNHRNTLEIKPTSDMIELNFGRNQFDFTQRSESQMNEDECPGIADKINNLRSFQTQFKDPILMNKVRKLNQ